MGYATDVVSEVAKWGLGMAVGAGVALFLGSVGLPVLATAAAGVVLSVGVGVLYDSYLKDSVKTGAEWVFNKGRSLF